MDVNYSAGKGSEGSEEHGRENVYHFGKYVNHHNRSMVEMWNVKGAAGKDSEWKYIHVICLLYTSDAADEDSPV